MLRFRSFYIFFLIKILFFSKLGHFKLDTYV